MSNSLTMQQDQLLEIPLYSNLDRDRVSVVPLVLRCFVVGLSCNTGKVVNGTVTQAVAPIIV